jgi:hypothetical protein
MIAMKNIILVLVLMIVACNANPGTEELKDKLKSAMTDFLYKGVNYDSAKVKFRVQDVVYYEDKNTYDCQFKVWMHENDKDTIGTMFAFVSKDFKTVKRTDLLEK